MTAVSWRFDPRSRTGSDRWVLNVGMSGNRFDPRSRTGSDRIDIRALTASVRFDPRSRTGSDSDACHFSDSRAVSIHAPARGATCARSLDEFLLQDVSIHAPARGATRMPPLLFAKTRQFRSTLPHGERRKLRRPIPKVLAFRSTLPHGERLEAFENYINQDEFRSTLPHGERHRPSFARREMNAVSIHAPARGATAKFTLTVSVPGGFDPRSRTGSDLRATRPIRSFRRSSAGFDPRSRTGSDRPLLWRVRHVACVSIHAPARGATAVWYAVIAKQIKFRSTLPHGERPQITVQADVHGPFRSTLPHGERLVGSAHASDFTWFRSTLPHGERLAAIGPY